MKLIWMDELSSKVQFGYIFQELLLLDQLEGLFASFMVYLLQFLEKGSGQIQFQDLLHLMQAIFQQKLKFSRTFNQRSKEGEGEAGQCEALANRLREILSTLSAEKDMMDCKIAKEREIFEERMESKQELITCLEEQNQRLKQEITHLHQEIDQHRAVGEYLKKKNSKLQLERDSFANIVQYLQKKGKELNEEIYELKKNKNPKQRLQKSQRDLSNTILPPYALNLNHQSLFQYTDFVEKDFLPLDLCRTQSCQLSESTMKNVADQSERITIHKKGMHSDQKKSMNQLDRVRSLGQINDTARDNTSKQYKERNNEHTSKVSSNGMVKQSREDRSRRDEKKPTMLYKKSKEF